MIKAYFKLFANCIPVKGAMRSCICDLQRQTIKFIPNLLYEILVKNENKSIADIKIYYENEYDTGIDAYFSKLVDEEWGFYTNEPHRFPKIDLTWESPYMISNAIFDCNTNWLEHFPPAINQLNELGCEALQLRFYDQVTNQTLAKILQSIQSSRIRSVELIVKHDSEKNETELLELVNQFKRITSIAVHSSPFEKLAAEGEDISLSYSANEITSHLHCGQISNLFFSLNTETFIESQRHNSCLNRKISIDINGEIKNCPSMKQTFGNIGRTTLQEALKKNGFKEFWNVSKDKIEICADCEFRYICTDCRAFVEDPTNAFSKPLKCGYDPYTTKWEDWNQNPLKQKIIAGYSRLE